MKQFFPLLTLLVLGTVLLSGCQEDMADQAKYEPLEASTFFADRRSARPVIADTVPFGSSQPVDGYETGFGADGELLAEIPLEMTPELLQTGRENYDVFCSPCHGYDGNGRGSVVERGFSAPPSLHIARLREAPAGHIYDVISDGLGLMYAYGDRVEPEERWAIVAYIRALQLSQSAPLEAVPEDRRPELEGQP